MRTALGLQGDLAEDTLEDEPVPTPEDRTDVVEENCAVPSPRRYAAVCVHIRPAPHRELEHQGRLKMGPRSSQKIFPVAPARHKGSIIACPGSIQEGRSTAELGTCATPPRRRVRARAALAGTISLDL